MTGPCPCGWGHPYTLCCGPLHQGATAPTAEALMRSRYSAFALRNAAYLAHSSLEPTSLPELEQWLPTVTWLGLTVVDAGLDEVEFVARSLEKDREVTLRERSRFVQRDGRWLYASGQSQVDSRRVARNEPCPCGSGRKFKSCHG